MSGINSTATTPEELAAQFPSTNRPFAVWYNPAPEVDYHWVVNGESCEAIEQFSDVGQALRRAAEIGSEWDAEARKQAEALAEVIEADDAIANALRVSASANRYDPEDVGHDIWMVYAQAIATLATVDRMEEIEGVEESDEFPAVVRAMLRDMKAKLEALALNVDTLRQPEVQHA